MTDLVALIDGFDKLPDLGTACYRYLSRNERLPRQNETEEEGLVTTLHALKEAHEEDIANLSADPEGGEPLSHQFTRFEDAIKRLTPSKAQSMVNKLFSQRLVLHMLMTMVEFDHGYFQKARFVQKTWLGKLIKTHGNVSDIDGRDECRVCSTCLLASKRSHTPSLSSYGVSHQRCTISW